MKKTLTITCTFDLICPWCWIGKAHLDRALLKLREHRPELLVQLQWRGITLIPNVPEQGWSFREFYERRLGSVAAVAARQQQVSHTAGLAGLKIHFEKMTVFPNTQKAYALLNLVALRGDAATYESLLNRLFEAYFVRGENLGDADLICQLAQQAGISRAALESWFANPDSMNLNSADGRPVRGVPHFLFDQEIEVSGVHEPESLFALMSSIAAAKENDLVVVAP